MSETKGYQQPPATPGGGVLYNLKTFAKWVGQGHRLQNCHKKEGTRSGPRFPYGETRGQRHVVGFDGSTSRGVCQELQLSSYESL